MKETSTSLPRLLVVPLLAVLAGHVASCGGSAPAPKPPVAAGEGATGESSPVPTFEAPGACVDPLSDGDKRDPSRPFDKHVQTDVRDEDLDGDGLMDVFVKPAWSCGDSCKRSAYVVRGTCAHWVGTFGSIDRYETLETKTNGLKDLSVRPRRVGDDGEIHCYNLILRFDGKQYQQAKQRECECKDEAPKCTAWDE